MTSSNLEKLARLTQMKDVEAARELFVIADRHHHLEHLISASRVLARADPRAFLDMLQDDPSAAHQLAHDDSGEAEKIFKRLKLYQAKHPAVLHFYSAFYTRNQDWRRVISTLNNHLKVVEDPAHEIAIHTQIANIATHHLNNPNRAIDAWKSVLRIDPRHSPAIHALMELYRSTRKWNSLVELHKQRIDQLPPDAIPQKVEIYRELVLIYRDELRLEVMVINTLRTMLDLQPKLPDVLEALADLYRERRRYNDLLDILERQARVASDPQESAQHLREAAAIYRERLHNGAQANALEQRAEALLSQD